MEKTFGGFTIHISRGAYSGEILKAIAEMKVVLMAKFSDVQDLLSAMDLVTTQLAANVQVVVEHEAAQLEELNRLKGLLSDGAPVTQDQLDMLVAGIELRRTTLETVRDHLQTIATDANNPISAVVVPIALPVNAVVDASGKPRLDGDGNRVDKDGNRLDDENYRIDDDGNRIVGLHGDRDGVVRDGIGDPALAKADTDASLDQIVHPRDIVVGTPVNEPQKDPNDVAPAKDNSGTEGLESGPGKVGRSSRTAA